MRLQFKSKRAPFIQRSLILFGSLLLLGFTWISCETKETKEASVEIPMEAQSSSPLTVDQEAVTTLKRGLGYLSGLDQFQVQTLNTYEDLLNNSIRVDYETSGYVTVDRPDKIRIERYGLEMHQLFYFNGNEFTLHNPYEKVYASEAHAGNIKEMFHLVRDTYGLSAPSADLIYPNTFELLMQNVNGAKVIGKEMIGEIMCDHLLFTRPNVSFQIWISDSEPFLPRKYVVTDTSTSHLFSYSTLMTNWNVLPKLSDSMFKYAPTDGTHKIIFMKTDLASE